jgi:hypothetical protein
VNFLGVSIPEALNRIGAFGNMLSTFLCVILFRNILGLSFFFFNGGTGV